MEKLNVAFKYTHWLVYINNYLLDMTKEKDTGIRNSLKYFVSENWVEI